MEVVIAGLLKDFEDGKMNRRQLIQSLAFAAAAVAAPGSAIAGAAQGAAPAGSMAQGTMHFKALSVDHISYQVADYAKTRDFYVDLMGMTVSDDDGRGQCYLHFGDHGSFLLPRNRRAPRAQGAASPTAAAGAPDPARQGGPAPVTSLVDHISYKIDNWDTDRVEAELKRRGLNPGQPDTGGANGPKNYSSFHVRDPDGFNLQISGDVKPGDRLWKG